jgi:threonine/homoserine/homoserine lactone efflux protein
MAASAVLAFWAVALLLIAVPGPDWAFTLSVAVRGHALSAAVAGLVVGYTAMTLVVAAGVGALVAGTPAALTVLTAVGGIYLIWLGLLTLAKPAAPTAQPTPLITNPVAAVVAVPRTTSAILAQGVGVSGLNPKGLLVFIALLPQFTDAKWAWPLAVQMTLLGLVFTVTCAAFYTGIGLFARTVLQDHAGASRVVSRISGVGMLLVGVSLLAEQFLR